MNNNLICTFEIDIKIGFHLFNIGSYHQTILTVNDVII